METNEETNEENKTKRINKKYVYVKRKKRDFWNSEENLVTVYPFHVNGIEHDQILKIHMELISQFIYI